MKQRKRFQKEHTDEKLKIFKRINISLILIMIVIVLHDSFVHNLPFYYILFVIAGLIIGRVVSFSQKVTKKEEEELLTLAVNPIGIIITILLLVFRFFAAKIILEQINVVWAADAVYLLFIGIYFSSVKNIVKQIDERVYKYLADKN